MIVIHAILAAAVVFFAIRQKRTATLIGNREAAKENIWLVLCSVLLLASLVLTEQVVGWLQFTWVIGVIIVWSLIAWEHTEYEPSKVDRQVVWFLLTACAFILGILMFDLPAAIISAEVAIVTALGVRSGADTSKKGRDFADKIHLVWSDKYSGLIGFALCVSVYFLFRGSIEGMIFGGSTKEMISGFSISFGCGAYYWVIRNIARCGAQSGEKRARRVSLVRGVF